MSYLIDGHNLIPHIPGMHLSDLDDEQKLIDLLQQFARVKRRRVEVFFDQAPAGQSGTRSFGAVKAHFVRQGTTADAAILARLRTLGKTAPNWKVVSSDHAVQNGAHQSGAEVISSSAFSSLLQAALTTAKDTPQPEKPMTEDELDQWLVLFDRGKH